VFQCVLTYANVNIQILLIKLNAWSKEIKNSNGKQSMEQSVYLAP
jgi:hypothetical protein